MPTLEFLSDRIKNNNEDKPILDFNSQGLKYVLSEYTTKELDRGNDWKSEFDKYPKVLEFLNEISSS